MVRWGSGVRGLVLVSVVAVALPLVTPVTSEAVVVCQRKNKIKLRPDACKKKETLVDPSELGVVASGDAGGDLSGTFPDPTIAPGAITADKIAPEAMAAAGSITLLNQDQGAETNSTDPAVLDVFVVDVPGPGTLTVTVQGAYWLDADATSASAITSVAYLGLCDVGASLLDADCDSTYGDVVVQDPDDASNRNATPAFSLVRTVPVAAAGPRTFYVNGSVSDGAHTLSLWGCSLESQGSLSCGDTGPVATVVFTPASLTITRPLL